MASFRAQLSPHEESTLHLIAAGSVDPDELRPADVKRLIALGLVYDIDDAPALTTAGVARCCGSTTFDTRQEQQHESSGDYWYWDFLL